MKSVVAWLRVILLGVLKLVAKVLAPIAVLFVDRKNHPIWGVSDATDLSWWNTGVRNGVHNMTERPQVEFDVLSNSDDETLETLPGFQWRYCWSLDERYVSFRMVWGEPRQGKGKREFYIGWTMNDTPTMRLTFFQLRPASLLLIPVVLILILVNL